MLISTSPHWLFDYRVADLEDRMDEKIRQLIYVKERALFPISWLQKQDYCEYQIYLENVRGIKAEPTKAMAQG
jgi:hypothetical protein